MRTDQPVAVLEEATSEQLSRLVRSPRVQQLMASGTDGVRIVRVRSYVGQAFAPHGRSGFCWMHLNAGCDFDDSEWIVIICHELGHLTAGIEHHHDVHFRGSWQSLVSKAGQLDLLTNEQVLCATRMIVFGAASVFRG